jgi:hypothetical protein
MFYRAKRSVNYYLFNRIVRYVFDTPPISVNKSNLLILSMISERDIPMYLMSVKILYNRIRHGQFAIIIDRDLPEAQRDLLRHHLGGGVEFIILEDIDAGRCQRGGTWERLLTCIDRSAGSYVVQMDADTLALDEIPEVCEAIMANRAFTLADGVPLQTLEEAGQWAMRHHGTDHIVDATERAFTRHPHRAALKYIRGSSGFAGFAHGAVTRALAEEFHIEMEKLLGHARWREWGTEQVASNFVVANSPDPLALPWPAYATIGADTGLHRSRFGHFIGSDRFVGQRFARTGVRLLRELPATAD